MNALDILVLLVVAVSLFVGWRVRAVHLVFALLALAAGILVANHFQPQVAVLFQDFPALGGHFLAWVVPFVITGLFVIVLGGMLSGFLEGVDLKWLDHILGALLAGALSLLLIGLSLTLLLPRQSHSRPRLVTQAKLVAPLLRITQPLVQYGLEKFPI